VKQRIYGIQSRKQGFLRTDGGRRSLIIDVTRSAAANSRSKSVQEKVDPLVVQHSV
jgi:hypothetical protein